MVKMQIKKNLFVVLAAVCLAAGWTACDNPGMEIGENWVDVNTRVILIDTCTVELSNVLLDSIPTSGGTVILAGTYRSPHWGTTRSSSYLTFSKTGDYTHSEQPGYKQSVRFDSLTLWMRPDSTMYSGDTTKRLTLSLHRLTERVELDETKRLYGHSSFSYAPQSLVDTSFFPRPGRRRDLEIRLPDALGMEFLKKLLDQDDAMDDSEKFQRYFSGMVLTSDTPDNEAILAYRGTDSTCMMKLYYHTMREDKTEYQLNFKLQPSLLFNQIESDRTGTPLEGISFKNNEIKSRDTDNKAFIEGLTGIYTKIEFPHLNNICLMGDHGTVTSAILYIYPLANTFGRQNYTPIPRDLQMYISNEENVVTGAITDRNDAIQTGSLTYNPGSREGTYYTYDITDFIKQQLGKSGINKLHLQMIGAKYGYTLNNLIVANQNDEEHKNIELHITYAIYNEK